jgi:hypothetical protein
MPTTVVQDGGRTYSDEGYAARLRRPAWLEGWGALMPQQPQFLVRGSVIAPAPAPATYTRALAPYRPGVVVYTPPPAPNQSVVTARTEAQKTAITYKAPSVDVSPGPDVPEPPPEEGEPVAPPVALPVRKKMPPWVWAAGAGSALVVFWFLFRKKQ